MNQMSTPSWSHSAHHDPMVSAPTEDFASFLDLSDFSIDFGDFEAPGQTEQDLQHDVSNAMDTSLDGLDTTAVESGLQDPSQPIENMLNKTRQSLRIANSGNISGPTSMSVRSQPFQDQQIYDPSFRHTAIPPTPNSIELQGAAAQYYHHQLDQQTSAQILLERYQRMREDQNMNFTPLVSPAVTPLETQFIPEFTIPGTDFSPLTSPALEAQHQAAQRSVYNSGRSSDNSIGTSPIDAHVDAAHNDSATDGGPARKTRRKMPTPRNPSRAVRQSPATRGQRRKPPPSGIIPPKEVTEVIEDAQRSAGLQFHNGVNQHNRGHESSGTESISPEPISESLMGPPPAPRHSMERSPFLAAKSSKSPRTSAQGLASSGLSPATPASLMRLQKQPSQPQITSNTSSPRQTRFLPGLEQPMEDMRLPEAATATRPTLSRLSTQIADGQSTPTPSARTPVSSRNGSTSVATPLSASESPQVGAIASPTGSTSYRKPDAKQNARNSKKRNSSSSVHVSPALRPKVSPSIKPLLPEGVTISAETSALLLATKSNYQNILEGTHLPGVVYHSDLATNLSYKRTSHKLAEQGRRDRINTAIETIKKMLPSNGKDDVEHGNGGSSNSVSGTTNSSKASTVEMAIEYLKDMQVAVKDANDRAEKAEQRARLAEQKIEALERERRSSA